MVLPRRLQKNSVSSWTKGLPSIVLRTSRFFPEPDDDPKRRQRYDDVNLKVNEYLYRRLDLADAVEAHLIAAEQAPAIGFGRCLVSATTPFEPEHLSRLRSDAPGVVRSLFPDYEEEYSRRGWTMLLGIDRVYVNHRAREELAGHGSLPIPILPPRSMIPHGLASGRQVTVVVVLVLVRLLRLL